ncbi:hypothetical protein [Kineosporia succinea]|uniref:Uncharacterized protein n=1 Tax=Kineosporia succinea TaxID=84632 RepID=A0ABT9P5T0_9ACTN|nr:hypothetical protein [Kineosporia succinea]MDP9827774.1 hypothetical protein [Kineosporia succinea]
MAEPIVINEAYLKARKTDFANFYDQAVSRLGYHSWTTGQTFNLSQKLVMPSGGGKFTPGTNLYNAAEAVRENFAGRMGQFKIQSENLYEGLDDLLENQEEIQNLNNITADEFGYYVEEVASGPATTSGGQTT